ncbi:restriction endonuclease subunit S, partial [candidate division WOR-3 bacterium]|nr:restriction endonuclease subunit S [candidate division WOR-3 bacterium]
YKEWFVKFRFPGYEKVKMVKSELGMMPQEWETCEIASLGKVITGKTPSTKETDNFGNYMPFITIPDMHNKVFIIKSERYLSEKGVNIQSSKTLPRNSICVSCIATMGLVAITIENSQTNQQINSIILEDLSILEYLFFVLKTLRTKITLYGSSGTTANILNKDEFSRLKILKPEKGIIKQFHCVTEPIFKQIENIMRQNNNLRQTRDMLLPMLISGEIEVKI